MAEGNSTYRGLAVPLSGESEITQLTAANDILTLTGATSMAGDFLVCQDVDGSEIAFIMSTGQMRMNVTTTATAFALDIRSAMSATTGWNGGLNVENTVEVESGSTQTTAIRACLNSTGHVVGSGRVSAMTLYWKVDSSAPGAMRSYLHADCDSGAPVFLSLGANNTEDASCWTATGGWGIATRGLRMYQGTDVYYIMVTSCTA